MCSKAKARSSPPPAVWWRSIWDRSRQQVRRAARCQRCAPLRQRSRFRARPPLRVVPIGRPGARAARGTVVLDDLATWLPVAAAIRGRRRDHARGAPQTRRRASSPRVRPHDGRGDDLDRARPLLLPRPRRGWDSARRRGRSVRRAGALAAVLDAGAVRRRRAGVVGHVARADPRRDRLRTRSVGGARRSGPPRGTDPGRRRHRGGGGCARGLGPARTAAWSLGCASRSRCGELALVVLARAPGPPADVSK